MSSVDRECVEDGQGEKAARAEELKNTANQFFKGRSLYFNSVNLTVSVELATKPRFCVPKHHSKLFMIDVLLEDIKRIFIRGYLLDDQYTQQVKAAVLFVCIYSGLKVIILMFSTRWPC